MGVPSGDLRAKQPPADGERPAAPESTRAGDQTGELALLNADAEDSRRRWWTGVVATVVVMAATAGVLFAGAVVFRVMRTSSPAAKSPALSTSSASAAASASAATTAAASPAAAAPATDPSTAAPPSAAPSVTLAPITAAAGKATVSGVTAAFSVADKQPRVGRATTINFVVTGPATEQIQDVVVQNSDGTELQRASAPAQCAGPPLPWNQSFSLTFTRAESTEVVVTFRTCSGITLVARGIADIQP